jgi:hypothetical protein
MYRSTSKTIKLLWLWNTARVAFQGTAQTASFVCGDATRNTIDNVTAVAIATIIKRQQSLRIA